MLILIRIIMHPIQFFLRSHCISLPIDDRKWWSYEDFSPLPQSCSVEARPFISSVAVFAINHIYAETRTHIDHRHVWMGRIRKSAVSCCATCVCVREWRWDESMRRMNIRRRGFCVFIPFSIPFFRYEYERRVTKLRATNGEKTRIGESEKEASNELRTRARKHLFTPSNIHTIPVAYLERCVARPTPSASSIASRCAAIDCTHDKVSKQVWEKGRMNDGMTQTFITVCWCVDEKKR